MYLYYMVAVRTGDFTLRHLYCTVYANDPGYAGYELFASRIHKAYKESK